MRPLDDELAGIVHRNIESLLEVRRRYDRELSTFDRIAQVITKFTGSIPFLAIHAVLVLGWLSINTGLVPGLRPFDPFPFVMLAMVASVEAIFLSTFVLISQNLVAKMQERRAELDLQVNLLTEHEITRLLQITDAIARHLNVPLQVGSLDELKKDIDPESVLRAIEDKTPET